MKKLYALLFVFGLFLVSCEEDDAGMPMTTPPEQVVITPGSANFSNYVSLGNSLTAGFSDAALFIAGQEASLPNMLASNFALAGGCSPRDTETFRVWPLDWRIHILQEWHLHQLQQF